MFKQHRHLFIHPKLPYKKLFFIGIFFIILLGSFIFIHINLKNEINIFLKNQQKNLNKQNLIFKFSLSSSWGLWPQASLAYPTIQKRTSSKTETIWQTKHATISYSIWHPLSLSIKLDGDQFFCSNNYLENCLLIHGSPWHIYVPLLNKYEKNVISIKIKKFFYTNNSHPIWDIHSLQAKNIKASLYWSHIADAKDRLIFSEIRVGKAFVNISTLPIQKLDNIQLQATLITQKDTQDFSPHLYKLLIHKINFSWNTLLFNSSGKLYLFYPQLLPTGEISLHLNNINQAITQQMKILNCCSTLQEKLSQISLPSQLNFTLLIREGVFYLGAIPLQTIWYEQLKTLIHTYTK